MNPSLDNDRPEPESTPGNGPLPDFVDVAFKAKKWLAVGAAVGLVLGILYYIKTGPKYAGFAQILVSKRTALPLKQAEAAAAVGDRGEHVALIKSPLIIDAARKLGKLDETETLAGEDDPTSEILDVLKVKRSAGQDRSVINVLDLEFGCGSQKDAEAVLAAVIEAYREYLDRSRRQHVSESVKLIRQASQDLWKQIQEKQQAYVKFRQETPLYWRSAPGIQGQPGEVTNVYQERLLAIENDRRLTRLRRAETEAKLRTIREAVQQGIPKSSLDILVRRMLQIEGLQSIAGLDMGQISSLQSQLLQLLLEEQNLLLLYGPDHAPLKIVRNKIRMTEEFFRRQGVVLPDAESLRAGGPVVIDFVAIYETSLEQQLVELKYLEETQDKQFEEASKKAKEFTRYLIEDEQHNNDIKRLKGLWDAIMARLDEVKFGEDAGGYDLEVISPPKAGVDGKQPVKLAVAGMFAGLALAYAVFYLRALLDTSVKSVDDVRQIGFPVLGGIPTFASPRVLSGSLLSPTLCYFHRAGSPEAEAYRSLRTAVLFATHDTAIKVLQVTSPQPQDGKSTVAANLALALAHSGRKVLLIDADLRCPKQHELFGLGPTVGLAEILSGDVDFETAIQPTESRHLDLIPAGLKADNPAEMLDTDRLGNLVARVRSRYDVVLVDTPPLLAVSDPLVVASRVDAVVLVLRVKKNRRGKVLEVYDLLATHRVNLLGVAVNGIPDAAAQAYGGYQTGYADAAPGKKSRRERAPEPALNDSSKSSFA